MFKKTRGFVALMGISALTLFLLNCGSSSSRPSGLLYVLTEGSNGVGNNVSSFSIDENTGSLSLLNSNATTCSTTSGSNPVSCGPPLDIVLDATDSSAFVLNQGVPCTEELVGGQYQCANGTTAIAPTIYPFNIGSDGSFGAPAAPITWSCGSSSSTCANSDGAVQMVRDPAGQFLFVINKGSFPSPGYPTPSPSNPSCPHAPTSPTDVCPSISVFAMQSGSTTLTLAPGSPFYLSKIPTGLSAISYTATGGSAQELLFVTGNLDICTANCVLPLHSDNTVSIYSVDSSGVLTEQNNSPYAITASNPISVQAVNTNPAGQNTGGVFVYVGSQAASVGAINPFLLCTVVGNNGCTATDVQNNLMTPLKQACSLPPCNDEPPSPAGQVPVAMVPDPTNNFLYVVSSGSNQVFGFKIATTSGTLIPLVPASQPTGAFPVALALHPSVNSTEQFLFTSNMTGNSISGFTLNTTTGSMSAPITVTAPATPSGMAAK